MIKINTPVGDKLVRNNQLSENGRFLKVLDVLGNARWCAIETIQKVPNTNTYSGRFGTIRVLLKKTIFLGDA
jgi:hypothetical protein